MELKLGSFSLFLLGCLLLGAGVVGGVQLQRTAFMKCSVEAREFGAKTVVCEDGQVYKLVPEESDKVRWDALTTRVESLEEVLRPAEPGPSETDAGTE